MATNEVVLEGAISILAALEVQCRTVKQIYLLRDKHNRAFTTLEHKAGECRVPVCRVAGRVIDNLASGHTHGGALALAEPRRCDPIETLGCNAPYPFIVMLDGVEDPFNFGQAVRALYAAGVDGLVLRRREWGYAEGTVARASAGAFDRLKMAVVDSALQAAAHFRARGMRIACTSAQGDTIPIFKADLTKAVFLFIGGEKRGITRSFLEQTDLLLQVPYNRPFDNSLAMASAAAVIAFEVLRQRRY